MQWCFYRKSWVMITNMSDVRQQLRTKVEYILISVLLCTFFLRSSEYLRKEGQVTTQISGILVYIYFLRYMSLGWLKDNLRLQGAMLQIAQEGLENSIQKALHIYLKEIVLSLIIYLAPGMWVLAKSHGLKKYWIFIFANFSVQKWLFVFENFA